MGSYGGSPESQVMEVGYRMIIPEEGKSERDQA